MAPEPLVAGRLVFALDESQGLSKTRQNFIALCRGDHGMAKNAPNKKLHYFQTPIHRVSKGFVAQGGDITRGDGSGGEVNVLITVTRLIHRHSQCFSIQLVHMGRKIQRR